MFNRGAGRATQRARPAEPNFEHCAQRKTRGEIEASDPHHVANFDKFSNFRLMAQTLRPFKLLTQNFLGPLVFRI